MRILVGLSGGVDSSVAAWSLLHAGHSVVGVTMSIWDPSQTGAVRSRGACYGPEADDIESARALCERLRIPLHVVDCRDAYARTVLENFRSEYRCGRTPNPCVRCNPLIKFGALLEAARAAGVEFDRFATGHYARIERGARGRMLLKTARDARKDQTYFLYRLSQEQLGRTLFPLGELTKEQVRELARAEGLPAHDRTESQDFVCGDYGDLLGFPEEPGDIVDTRGNALGRHRGLWRYTVGQRRGLGLAAGEPLYVVGLDVSRNRLVVGGKRELACLAFRVADPAWIAFEGLVAPLDVRVKIRSTHVGAAARIEPGFEGSVEVRFLEPQESVAPGQSAVFYDGDTVVGGGIIDQPLQTDVPHKRER